jgi:cephalosporin hydroxylase
VRLTTPIWTAPLSRRRLARAALAVLDAGPRNAWQAYEAKQLGAAQKLRELAAFGRFLRSRHVRTVVELGSERGGALWMWSCVAAADALIVSVDLVQPRLLPSRGSQKVAFVQGDSQSSSTRRRVEEILEGRPIDFLFIDADHSYHGVRTDYEVFAPLVGAGGVVALHDILSPPPSEVARFWGELKRSAGARTCEFMDRRDVKSRGRGPWGGIGVLLVE